MQIGGQDGRLGAVMAARGKGGDPMLFYINPASLP